MSKKKGKPSKAKFGSIEYGNGYGYEWQAKRGLYPKTTAKEGGRVTKILSYEL